MSGTYSTLRPAVAYDRILMITEGLAVSLSAACSGSSTLDAGVYYSVVLTLSSMLVVFLRYTLDARDRLSMLGSW